MLARLLKQARAVGLGLTVATQNPVLRSRFSGKPEFVVNFFEFIAEEVRELMARLGFRTMDEMIGEVGLIDTRAAVDHWKASGLDLSPILAVPNNRYGQSLRKTVEQDHGLEKALDRVCAEATDCVLADKNILILSDRAVSAERVPIPALLRKRVEPSA